ALGEMSVREAPVTGEPEERGRDEPATPGGACESPRHQGLLDGYELEEETATASRVVPVEVEGPVSGENPEPQPEQRAYRRVAALFPDRPGDEEPDRLEVGQVERVVMKAVQGVAQRPTETESLGTETGDHVAVL